MFRPPRPVLDGLRRWFQTTQLCPSCPSGCRGLSGLVVQNPPSYCQTGPASPLYKPWSSLLTRGVSSSQALKGYTSNVSHISPDTPIIQIAAVQKDESKGMVSVTWEDGQRQDYPYIWLLDNCFCPSCYHAESQGRVVSFMELDAEVSPSSVEAIAGGQGLRVNWSDRKHRSEFDSRWLRGMRFDLDPVDAIVHPIPKLWGAEIATSLQEFGFHDILTDDGALLDFLTVFSQMGIVKVVGTPTEPQQIPVIAKRIGPMRDTSYGMIQPLKKGGYNVKELETDRALSYTTRELQLHTDMSSLWETTHMAFFHCITSDGEGGVSIYSDGFQAAETLRQDDPEAFRLLTGSQQIFRLVGEEPHNGPFDHVSYHPTIALDPFGNLKAIHYSTHARLPSLRMPVEDVRPLYKALQKFVKLIEDPEKTYFIKLQPGEMMIINNHRVLHGRTPFQDTSDRYLELGYVDWDHVTSRMRVLQNVLKDRRQESDTTIANQ